jgi:hypothetical protein
MGPDVMRGTPIISATVQRRAADGGFRTTPLAVSGVLCGNHLVEIDQQDFWRRCEVHTGYTQAVQAQAGRPQQIDRSVIPGPLSTATTVTELDPDAAARFAPVTLRCSSSLLLRPPSPVLPAPATFADDCRRRRRLYYTAAAAGRLPPSPRYS